MAAKKSTKKGKTNASKKSTVGVKKKGVVKKATKGTKSKKAVTKKESMKTKSAKKMESAQKNKSKKSIKKEVKPVTSLPKPKGLRLNYMNFIQFLLEFIVATGFFVGLFGFYYEYIGPVCVLPLTLINFIISFVENNRTISYTSITMVMALIALFNVPLLAFFAKLVGIALSISSIKVLSAKLHE